MKPDKTWASFYKGRKYTNDWEANEARRLDLWKEAGTVKAWFPQVGVPLTIAGKPVLTKTGRPMKYVLDFLVIFTNGTVEWREVKGRTSGLAFQVWHLKFEILRAMGETVILVGADGQPVEER